MSTLAEERPNGPKLVHGDIALVLPNDAKHEKAPVLAQYNHFDYGDTWQLAYWAYFGTDITSRPEEVEVIQRVRVVPTEE